MFNFNKAKVFKKLLFIILYLGLLLTFYVCGTNQQTTDGANCENYPPTLKFSQLPPSIATSGMFSFTINYTICDDYAGSQMWLTVNTPNGTNEYETWDIPDPVNSPGNYTFSHYFSQNGLYTIWVAMGGSKPNGQVHSEKYTIEISGGTNNLPLAMLQEAQRYIDYNLTWYNRNDNVLQDDNQNNEATKTRVWTQSVPYSLWNTDNVEIIASNINNWKQASQTNWYQYSPGKVGFNYYDVDHIADVGYPWPTDFSKWTGTCCQGFVYNCAKIAGYSFTSNENYRLGVNYWKDLGTQINPSSAQPGDIVYFEQRDANGIVVLEHVAIVETSSSEENNIILIQSLGVYFTPFNFQVCEASVGQTITTIQGPNLNGPQITFRRLQSQ